VLFVVVLLGVGFRGLVLRFCRVYSLFFCFCWGCWVLSVVLGGGLVWCDVYMGSVVLVVIVFRDLLLLVFV